MKTKVSNALQGVSRRLRALEQKTGQIDETIAKCWDAIAVELKKRDRDLLEIRDRVAELGEIKGRVQELQKGVDLRPVVGSIDGFRSVLQSLVNKQILLTRNVEAFHEDLLEQMHVMEGRIQAKQLEQMGVMHGQLEAKLVERHEELLEKMNAMEGRIEVGLQARFLTLHDMVKRLNDHLAFNAAVSGKGTSGKWIRVKRKVARKQNGKPR